MRAWNVNILKVSQEVSDNSFLGGTPKLPPGTELPVCSLCGHELSFLFQIAFPEGHIWSGKTLALFFCLDCFGHEYCIPELPKGPLKQAHLPEGFLDQYQRNFRVLVFDTVEGEPFDGCCPRVPFQRLEWVPSSRNDKDVPFTLGGRPVWVMHQDERPSDYAGRPLALLFQIAEGFRFPKLEDAPPQANAFSPTGKSPFPWYDLFARDQIYFWGTADRGEPKVYISVQRS